MPAKILSSKISSSAEFVKSIFLISSKNNDPKDTKICSYNQVKLYFNFGFVPFEHRRFRNSELPPTSKLRGKGWAIRNPNSTIRNQTTAPSSIDKMARFASNNTLTPIGSVGLSASCPTFSPNKTGQLSLPSLSFNTSSKLKVTLKAGL